MLTKLNINGSLLKIIILSYCAVNLFNSVLLSDSQDRKESLESVKAVILLLINTEFVSCKDN